MKRTIFLLDTMALAFRAYYALYTRPRTNSRGVNTSAVYGFTTTLIKLIKDHGMKDGAVVLDAGEKTFRNELFPEYKGTRDAPPEGVISNIPLIREVATALGLPLYEVKGVEADDVIGSLARIAEREGHDSIIVSPDKDFKQLLSPHVSIYKPKSRGEGFDHITEQIFREEYQLAPHQFIDVLALMGDSADNVPGVKGIGEKTAIKLLKEYGTLESLLTHAARIKGKRAREGLLSESSQALLSKTLVTIKTDVDSPLNWDLTSVANLTSAKAVAVYRRLEFESLLRRLGGGPQQQAATRSEGTERRAYDEKHANYRVINTHSELVALEKTLARQETVGLYALHSGGAPVRTQWRGLAVSWAQETACFVPFPLQDGTGVDEVIRILAPVFTNPNVEKVGHGIKPLLVLLGLRNVRVAGALFDTEVAHYLLDVDKSHTLRFVARAYLRYDCIDWESIVGSGRTKRPLQSITPEALMVAACESAALPLELRDTLDNLLDQRGLKRVAHTMEFPLVHTLAHMEIKGITVNGSVLAEAERTLSAQISELETKIYAQAGGPFNIASPKQVGEVLFGRLSIPVPARYRRRSGTPSTREVVLTELAAKYPICGDILDWRKASRLVGTYIKGLRRHRQPDTGRVHTLFNQTSAATGRLSSSDPGLQNVPNRSASGRELRRAFVAAPGCVLLSADYSQIELRILAHMSGDENLASFFRDGRDPHTETAARIHDVDPSSVTHDQRSKAKAVNYGIPYGLSATGLSQQLRCDLKEARGLMEAHRASFPGVHRFLSEQVEKAVTDGYAVTLWGRRRYLPDLKARNRMVRSAAERIAVNMPIQGSQADMIKLAMVVIHGQIAHRGLRMRLLLQVHDELVFEVPLFEVDEAESLVRDAMVGALELKIPVEVNLSCGPTWLDAH